MWVDDVILDCIGRTKRRYDALSTSERLGVIRGQRWVMPLHYAFKQILQMEGLASEALWPKLGADGKNRELKARLTHSTKSVDVAYADAAGDPALIMQIKAPASSIRKNTATTIQNYVGESSRIHRSHPNAVIGSVVALPTTPLRGREAPGYVRHYCEELEDITGRAGVGSDHDKAEHACVILVHHSPGGPEFRFQHTDALGPYTLPPSLAVETFIKRMLGTLARRDPGLLMPQLF